MRMWRASEYDARQSSEFLMPNGVVAPANPYPLPTARLEDRPGYPFKVPSIELLHILHPQPPPVE